MGGIIVPPTWAVTWQIEQEVEPPSIDDSQPRPRQRAIVTGPSGIVATKDWLLPYTRVTTVLYTIDVPDQFTAILKVYDLQGNLLLSRSLPWGEPGDVLIFVDPIAFSVSPLDGSIYWCYGVDAGGLDTNFQTKIDRFSSDGTTRLNSWQVMSTLGRVTIAATNDGGVYFAGYDAGAGGFGAFLAGYRKFSSTGALEYSTDVNFSAFPYMGASRFVDKFWLMLDEAFLLRLSDSLSTELTLAFSLPYFRRQVAPEESVIFQLLEDTSGIDTLFTHIIKADLDGNEISRWEIGSFDLSIYDLWLSSHDKYVILAFVDFTVYTSTTVRVYNHDGELLSEFIIPDVFRSMDAASRRFLNGG